MFRLDGKTAVVTGAAHGIGRAISQVLAEAGAWTLLVDKDNEAGQALRQQLLAAGLKAEFVRADVASREDVRRAIGVALQQTARVDTLVCNAAYLAEFHDALGATEEEWKLSIDVALMGTHFFVQEVLPAMVRRGGGSIIFVSSIMALVGGPKSAAYMCVKAGLLGLMRSIAYDYGPQKIRVNSICPGSIRTRISPPPDSKAYQWQIENTLLGITGEPRDIAYAALYLASDEARFVTGITLPVDGGHTAK